MYRVAISIVALLLLSGCSSNNYYKSDFTQDGYLSDGFYWFDERANDVYEIKDGYLWIKAKRCQDLWGGTPMKWGAPIMWRDAPSGDYDVVTYAIATRVPYGSQQENTQVGLFVFQGGQTPPKVDKDNWLFFGFTNHDFVTDEGHAQGDGLIVTKTIGGSSSIVIQQTRDSDKGYLTITKRGNTWHFFSNEDLITSVFATFESDAVGMGVKVLDVSPDGAGCSGQISGMGKFDSFKVESK